MSDGSVSLGLTVMLLLGVAQTIAPAPAGASPSIDPAVRRAVHAGSARVIVELRLDPPFVAEGQLPHASALDAQRQAIARAQDGVLSALRPTHFALVRRYVTTPFLALTIGPDALTVLEGRDDLVSRVIWDSDLSPSASGRVPSPSTE